jgi:hypothetical protein
MSSTGREMVASSLHLPAVWALQQVPERVAGMEKRLTRIENEYFGKRCNLNVGSVVIEPISVTAVQRDGYFENICVYSTVP